MKNKKTKPLPEERETMILDVLRSRKIIGMNELHALVPVSRMTLWRDIKRLSLKANIRIFHGGVKLSDTPLEEQEDSIERRMSINADKKISAALKAVTLISEGQTVMLDASSASNFLARELDRFKQLRVITNCLDIGRTLRAFSQIEVVLLAGTLKHETSSLVGPAALKSLEPLSADICFFSATGLTKNNEVLDLNQLEIEVKLAMMRKSAKKILLFDSSKMASRRGAHVLGSLSDFNCLVTEKEIRPLDGALFL